MTAAAGAGVVITGAGSGIGAALAYRFATEGARVVINDIDPGAAAKTAASCRAAISAAREKAAARPAAAGPAAAGPAAGSAIAIPADAAAEDGVAALIGAARDALGEIDLYCANAGIGRRGGPEAAEADWADSWQVNVMAHVRAARLLLGPWLDRGAGHLICTVSAAGLLAMPGSAPYSVTKHAALAFAEWLALTYGHRGITVQAICPLGVRTGMLDGSDPGAEKLLGDSVIMPADVADAVLAGLSTGRFLILPHPQVAEFYAGRAADPDRWLHGMSLLQQRLEGS